jgi:hypothetical protein
MVMAYYAAFLLFCGTAYCVFKAIYWLLGHGWRSMLGLAEKRDEAINEAMPYPDTDAQPRTSDRHSWDSHTADAVLITHEQRDDDESSETAADFVLWTFECDDVERIRKYVRRMEKWSS